MKTYFSLSCKYLENIPGRLLQCQHPLPASGGGVFRWLASSLALSAGFLGLIARFTAPISRPKAERRSDFLQGLFLVFYPSCFGILGFTAAGQYRLFLPRSVCSRSYQTRVEFVTSFWAIRWVFVFRPSFRFRRVVLTTPHRCPCFLMRWVFEFIM